MGDALHKLPLPEVMFMNSILPGHKGQRKLVTAVLALILLGGLTATAAFRKQAPVPESIQAQTPAGPLSGWTILVDPGHGGYDGGARARDSGTWEKHLNLSVSLEIEKALIHQGAAVVMTRREDQDLCTENRPKGQTMKREDMERRIAIARESRADMVLSIHMNEYRSRKESGPQVFYRKGCEGGRLLAGCMQESLIRDLSPAKARAAMAGDYFILQLDVPSVLVECGFLSNAAEEKLLLSPDYQAQLAQAVARGAAEYAQLSQGKSMPLE